MTSKKSNPVSSKVQRQVPHTAVSQSVQQKSYLTHAPVGQQAHAQFLANNPIIVNPPTLGLPRSTISYNPLSQPTPQRPPTATHQNIFLSQQPHYIPSLNLGRPTYINPSQLLPQRQQAQPTAQYEDLSDDEK